MYIDAGTGSIMLQIIAAGFFTAFVFFKKIKSFFKKSPVIFARNEEIK
jgi:hypothetical protein